MCHLYDIWMHFFWGFLDYLQELGQRIQIIKIKNKLHLKAKQKTFIEKIKKNYKTKKIKIWKISSWFASCYEHRGGRAAKGRSVVESRGATVFFFFQFQYPDFWPGRTLTHFFILRFFFSYFRGLTH